MTLEDCVPAVTAACVKVCLPLNIEHKVTCLADTDITIELTAGNKTVSNTFCAESVTQSVHPKTSINLFVTETLNRLIRQLL